jgi:serine/threonine protein kinase
MLATDSPAPKTMLSAGTQLGPYEVVGLLATGGMGEVYGARDPRLGREVAIKLLPEARTSDIHVLQWRVP